MKYKITFKYSIDYVYCNEYKVDDNFVQPLKDCTIARTNIISISKLDEYKQVK